MTTHTSSRRNRSWLPLLLLAAHQAVVASAAPNKWVFLVYMLADNNLEQFGLWDLEEIMAGMVAEPSSGCSTTACGSSGCTAGLTATYDISCSGGGKAYRCCPTAAYPEVLVLVDKGKGAALSSRMFSAGYMAHADYLLLETQWSTAKLVKALPGGQWERVTEYPEVDMASAATITDFLQDGLRRYPPLADGSRKYMVVFWDHGNGWQGYGADGTCPGSPAYADHTYCDVASMNTLVTGVSNAIAGVKDPVTNAAFKFDVIGFDACLMAMYETSAVLTPCANFLLASQLLEPGTGWDYSALNSLVRGVTAANAAVNPATGFTEKQVADLLIQAYVENSSNSGLTLALVDLQRVEADLQGGVSGLSSLLDTALTATPGLAMTLLQQRTLLGLISEGDGSVDLGALLKRLNATLTGPTKTQASVALAAYSAAVVAYARDGELADGTGMAIYFPPDITAMRGSYQGLVASDVAALANWQAFLQKLYATTTTLHSAGSTFDFVEAYAVPYWAVDSSTWITHGTLSSLMGLTADLMYGFISPAGTEFIIAGTTVGRIAERAAVGAWSGQLFGLVQDLTPGDGAVDGLALAYADEQRVTDTSGTVLQLILQMQVKYATSCYAPTSKMQAGTLKYVLDVASGATTLQLFVSTGARGEVASAQGGVIIPYLGSLDLTGYSYGEGVSFGYSDCLKWGYTNSIAVAAFNATQAVGILGLDLTRDLGTLLTVKSVDGRTKSLYGAFEPAQRTRGGCQCSQLWSYTDAGGQTVTSRGQCVNPSGDALAWCQYEPGSCTGTPTPVGGAAYTDYCLPTITLSDCKCHPKWSFGGKNYFGSCASTGDPRGSWCVVERASCGNARAHEYGASDATTASINGSAAALTGLDFDYCQVTTRSGCHCSNSWEYAGTRYNGTCRTGLAGGSTVPGISNETDWCFVDKTCRGQHLDGFTYDECGPEGGRVTEPTPAAPTGVACQLPVVYDGLPLHDCISFNHSTPGQRTPKPWCFTNQAAGAWGYCAPWSCSDAIKLNCPAGDPGSNLTAWAQPVCLETLCNARVDIVNITTCTADSDADKQMLQGRYATLAASAAFGQVLSTTTGSASLDTYCSVQYGQLCVDKVLDPACPGLYREDNVWKATTTPAQLCDAGCLMALCRLQEQGKVSVKGTPGVTGSAPTAPACADGALSTQVMWSLMRLMDKHCGWASPAALSCNNAFAPPQLCAADTVVSADRGSISDGVQGGGDYSASTSCSWTISAPDKPYISLNFSHFDTERLYDVVTVEDFEGVIGIFSGRLSGADVPTGLTTDTGLLRVNFTADGSLGGTGFAASFLSTSTPQLLIPTCIDGSKLLQVMLRSRDYGAEMGWLVTKRRILDALFTSTPSSSNIVMAGGTLPRSVRALVPPAVAAASEAEYKDYRSYYRYACLPTGDYNLFAFDSYGDGWDAGRVTLTQVFNASTGCVLVTDAAPTAYNRTTPFSITANADTSSSACGALTSPDGPYNYVEAGLVLMRETTNSFTLAKQRKLKEALAILLDVDTADVSFHSITNATAEELATSRRNTNASASSGRLPNSSSGSQSGSSAVGAAGGNSLVPATRRLQAADGGQAAAAEGSIAHMLQQQAAGSGGGEAHSRGRRVQELSKLAVSIPVLLASGALDASERQLLQAEQWLRAQEYEGGDYDAAAAAAPCSSDDAAGCTTKAAAAAVQRPAEEEEGGHVDYGEELGSQDARRRRRLQQLLTLDAPGEWQDSAAAVANASTVTAAVAEGGTLMPFSAAPNITDGAASNATGPDANSIAAVSVDAPTLDGVSNTTSGAMAALLAENPLGPSAGAVPAINVHSTLVGQLLQQQPLKPVVLPKAAKVSHSGGVKYARVSVQWSLRDAFKRQAAPAAGLTAAERQDGSGAIQAVPKPAPVPASPRPGAAASDAANTSLPVKLPFLPWAMTQTGSNNETLLVFNAIRPGRALQQLDEASRSSVGDAVQQQAAAVQLVSAVSIDPEAVAQMLQAGRQRPQTQHWRPLGTFRPSAGGTGKRRKPSAGSSSDATSSSKQPASVVLPLPRPDQELAGAPADTVLSSGQQSHHRQLLQAATNATNGVTVVVRVNGYDSPADATAASAALEAMVKNGSLRTKLAAQGWAGVEVGLLYSTTGSIGGMWDRTSLMLRIIIAVCGGAVGALCLLGIAWWLIRRRRMAGAARVPQQGARAGAVYGGSASARPSYMSPQQATMAGRLSAAEGVPVHPMPYPYPRAEQGYFSRSASPSAPMLTAGQQAVLAARHQGVGSPLGGQPHHHQQQQQQQQFYAGGGGSPPPQGLHTSGIMMPVAGSPGGGARNSASAGGPGGLFTSPVSGAAAPAQQYAQDPIIAAPSSQPWQVQQHWQQRR